MSFGSRALSRDAAILAAYFPVFDLATERWPQDCPPEIVAFVRTGRGLFETLHARVHGARLQPDVRRIKEWKEAAGRMCEGIALRDPVWFDEHWNEVSARGLKVPYRVYEILRTEAVARPANGVPSWRSEAGAVLECLVAFSETVDAFSRAVAQDESAPSTVDAFRAVAPAHDAFYSALRDWVGDNAPGANNSGPKDPTGGGFAVLSMSLQDGYKGVSLVHLLLLGLTTYGQRVTSDGKTEELQAALDPATEWSNDAMAMAHEIIRAGSPIGETYIQAYERLRLKHSGAEASYSRLQPYLDGMAPGRR